LSEISEDKAGFTANEEVEQDPKSNAQDATINEDSDNGKLPSDTGSVQHLEDGAPDPGEEFRNEAEDGTDAGFSADPEGADPTEPKKAKFRFSKDKNKKPDKQQERIAELEDRVKRQMAEFDNYRKRCEKEKSASFEIGAKSVLEKILPVVDNFERGLASLPQDEQAKPFAQGMTNVYRQLMTELEKLDVKPIDSVGQDFNPDFHNAVMQVNDENLKEGTVAQEMQKGYTYRDSVIRHSMVAVVAG